MKPWTPRSSLSFILLEKLAPLFLGKKSISQWIIHTQFNVDEANSISKKFSEISCDNELAPTPEEALALERLLHSLKNAESADQSVQPNYSEQRKQLD